MKRVLFAGSYFKQGGPWNVNRNLVGHFDESVSILKNANPLLRLLETIAKIIRNDIIIFSGIQQSDCITVWWAWLLRKKIVYIMHGCLELERKQNGYKPNVIGESNERLMLKKADEILCVSSVYKNLIAGRYPQYIDKLGILFNGIDWEKLECNRDTSINRNHNMILLIGGGRKTKRNLQVCQAVKELNEETNSNYVVHVYGNYNDLDDSSRIKDIPCVTFHEIVPQAELLRKMNEAYLFIQNSDFEPFSLGVMEALACGCNLLISKNVGAKDCIGALTNEDKITDPSDIEQIKTKIKNVMEVGNNERLFISIDKNATSNEVAAKRLVELANKIE